MSYFTRRVLKITASLYVYRPLLNSTDLVQWMQAHGFGEAAVGMHTTVLYNKDAVEWPPPDLNDLTVVGGHRSIKQFYGGATVLCFESPELQDRNAIFMSSGATSDYPTFRPRVTLTYGNCPPIDNVYSDDLYFGPEVHQELTGGYDPEPGYILKNKNHPLPLPDGDELRENGESYAVTMDTFDPPFAARALGIGAHSALGDVADIAFRNLGGRTK